MQCGIQKEEKIHGRGSAGTRQREVSIMEKIITFFINHRTPAKLEENVVISKSLKRLSISVDVEQENSAIIGYIVVRDEKNRIRLQKMVGYGERTMVIGKHAGNTTIGGVPGPIGSGTWKITMFLFKEYMEQLSELDYFPLRIRISGKKAEVHETIGRFLWVDRHYREQLWLGYYNRKSFYSSKERWYKGDFHTHTHLSDGKEKIERAMEKARMMDLDFYVPTEHNVIPTGWKEESLLILPGVEITAELGHCNLIGIDKMPERLPEIMEHMDDPKVKEYYYETIREAKKRQWIVSINHPFLQAWQWKYGEILLDDLTCMEIINNPTYTDARLSNDRAIQFLDFLWEDGHKIWGIGGSDSHNRIDERYEGADEPSIPGDPGTYVYCSSLTPDLLVENVKKGHIYVSRFCTADIQITSEGKSFLPGDGLEDQKRTVRVDLELSGQGEKPDICMIHNGKRFSLEVEKSRKGFSAHGEVVFEQGRWNWMRMEVRTGKGEFLLYTNPIWQGNKESRFRNYQKALEAFQE